MRLVLLFSLLPALLAAQSSFLKDPDIVWGVELEQDWAVDIPSLDMEWDSGIATIKLLRTEQNKSYWSSPFLAALVQHAVKVGKMPIFKDSSCRIPADWQQVLISTDTVLTFDPETYEEKTLVVKNEIEPGDFKAWRLLQILAYHKKSATWSTTVEAIAPLIVFTDKEGDSVGLRPLFWFRPENKRPKPGSNDIVWAKTTNNRQMKTRVPVEPVHPVKISDGYQNPVLHLLKVMETNSKSVFYDTWRERPLTPEERNSILYKTDTIVTFDPETYEEKIAVVRNDLNVSNIRHLRLLQTWYWDERRHRLSICLDGVSPLMDVFDSQGNFRYTMPLFLRKAFK